MLASTRCWKTCKTYKSRPVSTKSVECAYQHVFDLLQALDWADPIGQECPTNHVPPSYVRQCDATRPSKNAESGRHMRRLPAARQQSKRQSRSIVLAKPKAVWSNLAHPEAQLRHAESLWLPDKSYAHCRLTVNGRLVLSPIHFHVFDFAYGKTVCPEEIIPFTVCFWFLNVFPGMGVYARPHPGPLPRGEGEHITRRWTISSSSLQ
jgi:hypothetical protein